MPLGLESHSTPADTQLPKKRLPLNLTDKLVSFGPASSVTTTLLTNAPGSLFDALLPAAHVPEKGRRGNA